MEVFEAISDPVRREILVALAREGTLSAGEIAGRFAISRPAVSRHLRVLRESGVVRDEVSGRRRIYRLTGRWTRTAACLAVGAEPGAGRRCGLVGPVRRPRHRSAPHPARPCPAARPPTRSAETTTPPETKGDRMSPTPTGEVRRTGEGRDLVLIRDLPGSIEDAWASLTESERTGTLVRQLDRGRPRRRRDHAHPGRRRGQPDLRGHHRGVRAADPAGRPHRGRVRQLGARSTPRAARSGPDPAHLRAPSGRLRPGRADRAGLGVLPGPAGRLARRPADARLRRLLAVHGSVLRGAGPGRSRRRPSPSAASPAA